MVATNIFLQSDQGAAGNHYALTTAGLEHIETPSQADADALLAANPTWAPDDTIILTAPSGHQFQFLIKEDSANPGTNITTPIEVIQPLGVSYTDLATTLATDFAPNYRIRITGGSFPGNYVNNTTGTAWIEDDTDSQIISGGGGGDVTTTDLTNAINAEVAARDLAIAAAVQDLGDAKGGTVTLASLTANTPTDVAPLPADGITTIIDAEIYDATGLRVTEAYTVVVDNATPKITITSLVTVTNLTIHFAGV